MEIKTVEDQPNHEFQVVQDNGCCVVASFNLRVGDWAAYRGFPGWDWNATRLHGDKIDPAKALELFPPGKDYRYRQ